MASSAPNESFAARAAAIMTTSEVAGTSFDLNNAWGSAATVQIDFTQGSATNGVFRFYVSQDGSTWYSLYGASAAALTQTLTANASLAIPVQAAGWKFLRVSVQGTGTMTSSSATITVKYLRRGSQ